MKKRVLVLGGTGAMGIYTVPELAAKGYLVDVLSMDQVSSANQAVKHYCVDAKNDDVLRDFMRNNRYDAVIDYLIYETRDFSRRVNFLLENTDHYIFLSTYRIYDNKEHPVKETSPRLLDASEDDQFLQYADREYSLYKAQQENVLRASGYKNWSIVRPAITFSKFRYQLVTQEAAVIIRRAMEGKIVVLPESAMNVQATMSWAGDVAKMFAGLVLNPKAYGETFSLCTAEHHTWREIAQMYTEIVGLKYVTVDDDTYLNIHGSRPFADYQLRYDRCFDRIMDNSKILQVTGLTQQDLTPIREALTRELTSLPRDHVWEHSSVYDRMDAWLRENGL